MKKEAFDIAEVAHEICEKLIYRHPSHLRRCQSSRGEAEVKKNWEALKLKEGKKTVLGGVPKGLASLGQSATYPGQSGGSGF